MIDGWQRLRELSGWIHDEFFVRHRLGLNRLLKEPPEQEATELRFAPVEAESELVEVGLKMVGLHGPLMGSEQPSLEKAGDPVNSGQGHMGRVTGPAHHMGHMDIVVSNRFRVRGQAVGDDDGAGIHIVAQERAQGRRLGVGDDAQAATTEPLGAQQLNGYRYQRLALRAASSLSRLDAPDEKLVDFDLAGKPITAWPHHRRPKAVQHGPRGLIRTETEDPMQGLGRNAILRGSHVPRDSEPDHEWGPGAVEEGSSSRRYPALAWLAPEPPVGHPPMAGRPAPRANEAVGPSKPLKVVETCRVIREPGAQVSIAARIIPPRSKAGRMRLAGCWHPHILCLQPLYRTKFSTN